MNKRYTETELVSDVTKAIEVVSLEPKASELSSALEFYHDHARRYLTIIIMLLPIYHVYLFIQYLHW